MTLPLSPPSPPSKPTPQWKATFAAVIKNISDDPSHPLQIALRTYSLCLSLSLGPILLPAIFALAIHPKRFTAHLSVFRRAVLRELRPTGFASAITAAVGGGAALQRLWDLLERRHAHRRAWVRYINSKLSLCQRAFLANVVSSTLAFSLLRWSRYRRPEAASPSPTLDLSLLFLVRTLDALVQAFLLRKAREVATRQVQAPPRNGTTLRPTRAPFALSDTRLLDKQPEVLAKEWKDKVVMHLDALVFWASSARIMWCFFYQPQRLPPSFVEWISSLANVDKRLLDVLRGLRDGTWSYTRDSSMKRDIACSLAKELGRSPSCGDPTVLPGYGGDFANEVWKQLGVDGRNGIGGMPCGLVHGGVGASLGLQDSCIANAAIRAVYAFTQALVLHLPVYFLPMLLTKPDSIVRPRRVLSALLSAIRSATFLSTFVSSCWFGVCFTRTLVLARLLPKISHDVWDGPYGGTLTGSLVCGTSIWIENARRRREVALYVLPKALRASISEKWVRNSHPVAQFAESLAFILSLASLLTFSVHQPESLRGLSRWTLAVVMKGPNVGFWKTHGTKTAACPPTPTGSLTPPSTDSGHHED